MADEDQPDLYMGPDRGEFLVARLDTADGLFVDVNCRIKKASVFNFASQYAYALVGYQIEYWPKDAKAPYEGGTAQVYRPKDRPDFSTFYLRIKVSSTGKMLYLEDAIINDFITSKHLLNGLYLDDYTKAAQQQLDSIKTKRRVKATDVEYYNGVHTTRYESSASAPLTQTEAWMQYSANIVNSDRDDTLRYIRDVPFVSLKDMVDKIVADFMAAQS